MGRCYLGFAMLLGCCCGRGTTDASPPLPDVDKPAERAEPAPPAAPAGPIDCLDEPGMVYIAGGEYVDERTKKVTQIPAFWIDRTEATISAYRKFVADGFDAPGFRRTGL